MKTPETKLYRFKISVTHNGKWKAVAYKDIVYLQAAGNFTQIYVRSSGIIYNTSFTLKYLEKELPANFFRIHRSFIVNMSYIDEIGHSCVMTDTKAMLSLAKGKTGLLKQKLAGLPRLTIPNCNHCNRCEELETCKDIRPFIKWDAEKDDADSLN